MVIIALSFKVNRNLVNIAVVLKEIEIPHKTFTRKRHQNALCIGSGYFTVFAPCYCIVCFAAVSRFFYAFINRIAFAVIIAVSGLGNIYCCSGFKRIAFKIAFFVGGFPAVGNGNGICIIFNGVACFYLTDKSVNLGFRLAVFVFCDFAVLFCYIDDKFAIVRADFFAVFIGYRDI